jgi:PQQ-dependent dehydrogenase (methanol/ethanol family)
MNYFRRTIIVRIAAASAVLFSLAPASAPQSSTEAESPRSGQALFAQRCAGCHGENAGGTDRGPALRDNRTLRQRTAQQIAEIIQKGTSGGMPAFPLPAPEVDTLASMLHSFNVSAYDSRPPGDAAAGAKFFRIEGGCSACHMVAGEGRVQGPDLSDVGRQLTLKDIQAALDDPAASAGTRSSPACPGYTWCPEDPWAVAKVRLKNGSTIEGFIRSEGKQDLQLQSFDGKLHTLRESDYEQLIREKEVQIPTLKATPEQRRDLLAYLSSLDGNTSGPNAGQAPVPAEAARAVVDPKPGDWVTHYGNLTGNRRSELRQINKDNAAKLQLQWLYTMPHNELETTPLVSDGIMYVTGPNRVCALDARAGRQIWCYSRTRSAANTIPGDAAKGANRGVAILGDRIFFATDNAHLICLHRLTGGLMWDVLMPDSDGPYGATAAPLVIGDLVVSGIAGGEGPIRGFLAAYDPASGRLVWRFRTTSPATSQIAQTWRGSAIQMGGGGATWVTGSYDKETNTLFWATGNPYPDFDGDEREGDNLYTNCVLAMEAKTGKLLWYFQFTPHDLHDWDATQPLILANVRFQGADRKLLMQANRNGFFYVLDRTNGRLLLAQPYVKRLTWADGIDAAGRPKALEGNKPTAVGTKTCPGARGATNWHSPSFDPEAGLFYVMVLEDCNIFRSTSVLLTPVHDPKNPPARFLRAIDTGKVIWEVSQIGPPESSFSGVLSTAGGIVFYGQTDGGFAAVDSKTGQTLWHFPAGQSWRAGPMTYMVDGNQYVAIAGGGNVFCFAVPKN